MTVRPWGALLFCLAALGGCDRQGAPSPPPAAPVSPPPPGCRYIDKTGRVVIDPSFPLTDGFEFTEGLAGVKNDRGELGFVDRTGALVIPFAFADGTSFRQGTAGVLKDGMCGYIGRQGTLVIPLKYDSVTNFRNGWGCVKRNGAWTFVNARGKEMDHRFLDAGSFSEGLAAAAPIPLETPPDGARPRYGFVDETGGWAVAPAFEQAEPFSDGLAAVMDGGKWGYIDRSGTMAVAPRFEAAGPFSEGLAQVRLEGRAGYIDRLGKIVIEPRFELDSQQEDPDEAVEMTGKFVDGLACVRFALGAEAVGGWGFIDRTGRFVIPPRYAGADMFAEGRAAVLQNGKWGFVDPEGKLVVPAVYDRVKRFSEGLALVQGGR